jgi:preprotein translocase subunit SecE
MDKKPVVNTAAQKKGPGLREYFKGVKTEIKKVIWPTRKELVSYTVVVVLTCVAFALLFWGFDSGFLALLKAMLNISV